MDFLNLAAELAAKVDPHAVRPNPRVGCVISRGDEVVATGVHEIFGESHAEANATKNLESLIGYTVWVTLEPCDMFPGKKTPSCTERLIALRPEKIVVGALDPRFAGKNLEKFTTAGIDVEVVDHKPSKKLNPWYAHWVRSKWPYVIVKLAQSLDGKITAPMQRWISNEKSREKVHQLRAEIAAILTTTETIFADNPSLTCRAKNCLHPISDPDVVILGDRAVPENFKFFESNNRNFHHFRDGELDQILQECANRGIDVIMTEAGSKLCSQLIREDLVDEIQFFTAPKIFGTGKNTFDSEISFKKFHLAETQNLDGDVRMRFLRSSS